MRLSRTFCEVERIFTVKIKIDNNGYLDIKRGNKWRQQYCMQQQKEVPCGDHCPLFGEPMEMGGHYSIQLCNVTLIIDGEIIDERDQNE